MTQKLTFPPIPPKQQQKISPNPVTIFPLPAQAQSHALSNGVILPSVCSHEQSHTFEADNKASIQMVG